MAKYIKLEDYEATMSRILTQLQGYTFGAPRSTKMLISSYICREFDKVIPVEIPEQRITYKDIAVGCGFRCDGIDYVKMKYSTWTGGLKIPDCIFVCMTDDTEVEMTNVHFDVKPWDRENWMNE